MRHTGTLASRLRVALSLGFAVSLAAAAAAPAAAQQASDPASGETITLVALGDSLSAGYELPASAAFPAVLERELRERGHDVAVINAGVSGDTASGGLARLDWSVPEEADGVILELGANDMLRGVDPQITREALEAIVERLEARDVPVLLAGMVAGRNMGRDYVEAFDSIYPSLAERHDLPLYPFFLEGAIGNPELMLADGIHPNAEGVETIVEGILPLVETFVSRIRDAQG